MGVRWVFFDVDGTLCDFQAMRQRALAETVRYIRERIGPVGAAQPTAAGLQETRDEIAASAPASMSMEAIRRAAFEVTLQEIVPGPLPDLVDEVTDFYLSRRFADPIVFDDVRPALDELSADHRLGVLSNGNSYVERLGLSGYFNEIVMAAQVGHRKPDPAVYALAARRAGVPPRDTVMVGDSLSEDVLAPMQAGWRAVWLRRHSGAPEAEVPTIATLRELPQALQSL